MSYPEGESHSKRKMARAEAWMETRATSIHEAKSNGSEFDKL